MAGAYATLCIGGVQHRAPLRPAIRDTAMNIPFAIFILVLVSVMGSIFAQIYKYKAHFVEKRNREQRLEQDILERIFAMEQRINNLEDLMVARLERKGKYDRAG
jgi:hypothetical protein